MKEQKNNILLGVECFEGGVLKHVRYLAEYLDPTRYQLHLIVSSLRRSGEVCEAIDSLRSKGILVVSASIRHNISPWNDFRSIRAVCRYIQDQKIDLVHAHSSKAGVIFRAAAKLTRKPCIYTPHCFYYHAHQGLKRRFFLEAERWFGKITDACVVAENEYYAVLNDRVIDVAKTRIINNAIREEDYPKLNNKVLREKYGFPRTDILIGGIGRLCPQKNWSTFILAASRLLQERDDLCFVIAGEGPQRKELQNQIDSLGLGRRVHLLGAISPVAELFSCLDRHVSTSGWEGLPYTYLEAAHYGLPMFIAQTPFMDRLDLWKSPVQFHPVGNDRVLSQQIIQSLALSESPENIPRQNADPFGDFLDKHQQLYDSILEK